MEDGFEMRGAFIEKILQKTVKHFVKKKYGVDLDLILHDVCLNFEGDKAYFTIYADASMGKEDFKKSFFNIVLKG